MRRCCLVMLLGVGACAAVAAEPAPAPSPLDNLVKNSPFGVAAPGTPGAENTQLEFRGVFVDKGEQFFSFYEPASRQSQWIGLKETGAPYAVQSYDSATQTVKVLYRNQALTLTLKRAQIVVQANPPPALLPGAAPVQPGAPVMAPTPADEAARLAQVAEEIRRRRALRAYGNQPPGQQPGPQPQVTNPGAAPAVPVPNRP